MKRRSLILASLATLVLTHAPALRADPPGDAEWQAVKAIIQERPRTETEAQHADRLARMEAAHATAMAAAPLHPLRWDAVFFRAMDVLLGPAPPPAAAVETHLTHLRTLLKAADSSPETKALSSGLIVLTTSRAIKSIDAARIWLAQAQQHLATYPNPAATSAAAPAATTTTFDPQTLPLMNQLIEDNVLRYAGALKRSEEGEPAAAPGAPTGTGAGAAK